MSEFTCRNGHLMRPTQRWCTECGEPLHYMDGESRSELKAREQMEDERETDDTTDRPRADFTAGK